MLEQSRQNNDISNLFISIPYKLFEQCLKDRKKVMCFYVPFGGIKVHRLAVVYMHLCLCVSPSPSIWAHSKFNNCVLLYCAVWGCTVLMLLGLSGVVACAFQYNIHQKHRFRSNFSRSKVEKKEKKQCTTSTSTINTKQPVNERIKTESQTQTWFPY